MRRLSKTVFFTKELLPKEDEKVYELFHYVGEELPEKFDSEDLADVVQGLVDDITFNPERLPYLWMQQNPTLVAVYIGKILELLEKVNDGEKYVQAFREEYNKRNNS